MLTKYNMPRKTNILLMKMGDYREIKALEIIHGHYLIVEFSANEALIGSITGHN